MEKMREDIETGSMEPVTSSDQPSVRSPMYSSRRMGCAPNRSLILWPNSLKVVDVKLRDLRYFVATTCHNIPPAAVVELLTKMAKVGQKI